ncbi:MFS transporter [Streptomyces sp. NPDC102270]|uniref:MFS transporter n=1 Tax=Streptomyces sp. NPDC102270 TaxID=3366150 RepID=UPI00380E5991
MALRWVWVWGMTCHGKERGAAFGMYSAVAGFASAIGLLLGGALTDADLFGWGRRSVFLVNVPVSVVTLVAGALLVPATRERSAGSSDALGSLGLRAHEELLGLRPVRRFSVPARALRARPKRGVPAVPGVPTSRPEGPSETSTRRRALSLRGAQ